MSRAQRARSVAGRAAFGGGGLAAMGLLGLGVLRAEAEVARHVIGDEAGVAQEDSGRYGAGVGEPLSLLVLGDSTAAGVGADSASTTVGATIATGIAAMTGRPVDLVNASRSGATSVALPAQVETGLADMHQPDVAIIMIGANDVKERLDLADSIRHLSTAVHALQALGVKVVVGTCPDLGTIRPVPQPLRWLAQRWSRDLAAAQTVAVVEAGARTVSLGDLIGPDFHAMPTELFSSDRFHPSSAGYARAAAALLPSVSDALGLTTPDSGRSLDHRRGEAVEPLAQAAERAVDDPGTEVSGAVVDGQDRGTRGRWAQLLRRQRTGIDTAANDETPESAVDAESGASNEASKN
ncbi:SGNH/GDSL hydrolase family protein [Ornithinimicrobium sp. Arc0846-15]|nr:SGNH/GDSL hydrolase family protein [Ornithinimicrobium laminariae]